MKTEEQIRRRLRRIQQNKAAAKYKGFEKAYIINCKVIKLFKWVLEEEPVKRKYRPLKR